MADRYWVGGTDNWNGTAGSKWALTSGGTGGEAVPTAADDVFFDANSGTVTVTVATTAGLALNLNFTGFTGTIAGATGITVTGNLTLDNTMAGWTNTGTLTLNATATTQVITSNGVAMTCPITRSGVGGSAQLVGNLTTGATRAFTLTDGDLDLNGAVLSCGIFAFSGTATKSVTTNGGSITLTGNNTTILNCGNGTGYTLTGALTVTATYSGATGTRVFLYENIVDGNDVSIAVTAGTDIVNYRGEFKNVDFTGFAGTITPNGTAFLSGNLTIPSGVTYTSNANVVTFRGTSGTQVITTNGITFGSPITFNGVGGTFQLAGQLNQAATRAVLTTNGTLDLNGFKITGGLMTIDDTAAAGSSGMVMTRLQLGM